MKVAHFSAGELLRNECASNSETGKMISEMLKEGKIVPSHVTIGLLKDAMISNKDKYSTFLIDGFPRNIDQGVDFERQVKECSFVLFLDAPEDVMVSRLLNRGESSGRSDDNVESIRKVADLILILPISLSSYVA